MGALFRPPPLVLGVRVRGHWVGAADTELTNPPMAGHGYVILGQENYEKSPSLRGYEDPSGACSLISSTFTRSARPFGLFTRTAPIGVVLCVDHFHFTASISSVASSSYAFIDLEPVTPELGF